MIAARFVRLPACLALLVAASGCGDDVRPVVDAGTDALVDTGAPDATPDAGTDSGLPDSGLPDSGPPDVAPPDTGPAPNCMDMAHNGDETDVDCGGSCPPCADGLACGAGADCTSRSCILRSCQVPACTDGIQNGDETGRDCGGMTCGGCVIGGSCLGDPDCAAGTCIRGTCSPMTCNDMMQSGMETDVDCGGPECTGCAGGLMCAVHRDCTTGFCRADRMCVEASCTDAVQNGMETDVDCGGMVCAPCADGNVCLVASDCGQRCTTGVCTSCTDGVQNGTEVGVDCAGDCPLACPAGTACTGAVDCASGRCVMGSCAAPAATCLELHAIDATLGDGVYAIQPPMAMAPSLVYCDMTTDGGGWTLVASTLDQTLDDESSPYYNDLTTLFPARPHAGVWNGLRSAIAADADIRFACKADPMATPMTVDLSFYNIGWYRTITTGTDGDSCFSEGDMGTGDTPPRRDNLSGMTRPSGAVWSSGKFEGEDFCFTTSDFTVDFDDRGMNSNESDGTDWGEDDLSMKCGIAGLMTGSWFIFVRETQCADGTMNGTETDVDCGGAVCNGCADGGTCAAGTDCVSTYCAGTTCTAPTCMDMVTNGTETDVDCGGATCPVCAVGGACIAGSDCGSGVCAGAMCAAPSCTDGVQNGGETDVDCGGATSCPRCADFQACVAAADCLAAACTMGVCGTTGCVPFGTPGAFGYTGCTFTAPTLPCPDISGTGVATGLGDDAEVTVPLGFSFDFYGTARTMVEISSNGVLAFDTSPFGPTTSPGCFPRSSAPRETIAPFWDDMNPSRVGGEVFYETRGAAPNRTFVVRWDAEHFAFPATGDRAVFTAVLHEGSNGIDFCYQDTIMSDVAYDGGASATAGIQGSSTDSHQFSCNTPNLTDGLVIRYAHP